MSQVKTKYFCTHRLVTGQKWILNNSKFKPSDTKQSVLSYIERVNTELLAHKSIQIIFFISLDNKNNKWAVLSNSFNH